MRRLSAIPMRHIPGKTGEVFPDLLCALQAGVDFLLAEGHGPEHAEEAINRGVEGHAGEKNRLGMACTIAVDLAAGGPVVVLGAAGAGKSTLARAVVGLIPDLTPAAVPAPASP